MQPIYCGTRFFLRLAAKLQTRRSDKENLSGMGLRRDMSLFRHARQIYHAR